MLRRGFAALVAGAVGLGATAATAQTPGPPTSVVASTLLISGHGWGHGLGMSQWGANGYAQHGWTFDRILAHYYPGTQLGPAPVTKIRVLLVEGKKALKLTSAAPWRVTDGSGGVHELPAGPATLRADLTLTTDPFAEPLQLTEPLTFAPAGAPLELGRPYRGTIRVTLAGGKLQAVNELGLEAYLKGVVPAEMPSNWQPEALKTQAAAARSYALSTRATGRPYDVFSDTRSQVYIGRSYEKPSTNAAVDATKGQVLLYRGQVAFTMFHSSSGGRTLSYAEAYPGSAKYPYLASVADPYDTASPYHDWGPVLVDATKAGKALKVPGQLVDLEPVLGASGRAAKVRAHGTNGDVDLSAAKLRAELGLRSTWFSVGLLSLSRPYGPLAYGSTQTVTGRVRGAQGLSLEQRSASSFWQPAPPVSPTVDGGFTFAVNPTATTDYRLVSGTIKAFPLRVTVAPVVTLSLDGAGAALTGTTSPVLPGATVEVQRQDGIVWTTAATASVDASGVFTVPLPLAPGAYRARLAPGRGLVAGTSASLPLG